MSPIQQAHLAVEILQWHIVQSRIVNPRFNEVARVRLVDVIPPDHHPDRPANGLREYLARFDLLDQQGAIHSETRFNLCDEFLTDECVYAFLSYRAAMALFKTFHELGPSGDDWDDK